MEVKDQSVNQEESIVEEERTGYPDQNLIRFGNQGKLIVEEERIGNLNLIRFGNQEDQGKSIVEEIKVGNHEKARVVLANMMSITGKV